MANPTTYFGWVMPTSTDLVTDLPADFNVFGQGVDTSMQDLLGGTTGQLLSKTSNTNMDFTWTTVSAGGMTLLSTTTMSGVTTTVSSISGAYKDLIIEIAGAAGTGGSADQNFKFFMNGATTGSTITTAAYASSTITNRWTALYLDGNTPTNVTISGGANAWYIRIADYASTTNRKSFDFNGTYNDSTVIMGTGSSYSTAAITSIGAGFVTASANAGTIKVWGLS